MAAALRRDDALLVQPDHALVGPEVEHSARCSCPRCRAVSPRV